MPKFSFEFATLAPAMEQTLRAAPMPIRTAIGRGVTDALGVPMNRVQAKRLGIAAAMNSVAPFPAINETQRQCGDALDEAWVRDVVAICQLPGFTAKSVSVF